VKVNAPLSESAPLDTSDDAAPADLQAKAEPVEDSSLLSAQTPVAETIGDTSYFHVYVTIVSAYLQTLLSVLSNVSPKGIDKLTSLRQWLHSKAAWAYANLILFSVYAGSFCRVCWSHRILPHIERVDFHAVMVQSFRQILRELCPSHYFYKRLCACVVIVLSLLGVQPPMASRFIAQVSDISSLSLTSSASNISAVQVMKIHDIPETIVVDNLVSHIADIVVNSTRFIDEEVQAPNIKENLTNFVQDLHQWESVVRYSQLPGKYDILIGLIDFRLGAEDILKLREQFQWEQSTSIAK